MASHTPIRVYEEPFYPSKLVPTVSLDPRNNLANIFDESSCFEEEFVGPSMDEHGDASSSMHSPKGWENEKTPATYGLPPPPPDHYPTHSTSNVEFVKPTPEVNSIGHVSSLDHVIPEVDILRPIPGLNYPPSQDKEISPNDLDLDELISSFQRISDTADKVDAANKAASDVGGIRRKCKEKKEEAGY
ncbi:hypothetical protein Tco_1271416, partial [Tanacetum coccineum]